MPFAVGIPKFVSFLDGVKGGYLKDPGFVKIVKNDLKTGQHRNPAKHPYYFTSAYFHHPSELKIELEEAGFKSVKVLSIEGPIWLASNLENLLKKKGQRNQILTFLREIEAEPTVIGSTDHMMAIGTKS